MGFLPLYRLPHKTLAEISMSMWPEMADGNHPAAPPSVPSSKPLRKRSKTLTSTRVPVFFRGVEGNQEANED